MSKNYTWDPKQKKMIGGVETKGKSTSPDLNNADKLAAQIDAAVEARINAINFEALVGLEVEKQIAKMQLTAQAVVEENPLPADKSGEIKSLHIENDSAPKMGAAQKANEDKKK